MYSVYGACFAVEGGSSRCGCGAHAHARSGLGAVVSSLVSSVEMRCDALDSILVRFPLSGFHVYGLYHFFDFSVYIRVVSTRLYLIL
jgi:hypothetical protein